MPTLKKKNLTDVDIEENHFETKSCLTQVDLRLAEKGLYH